MACFLSLLSFPKCLAFFSTPSPTPTPRQHYLPSAPESQTCPISEAPWPFFEVPDLPISISLIILQEPPTQLFKMEFVTCPYLCTLLTFPTSMWGTITH